MLGAIFYVLIFIFGTCIGSFLNCVIYRLEQNKGFLFGRSYCPKCKQELKWLDLIPIFSFIVLKGKCRYCKKPISFQYPLIELTAGMLFLLISNFQFSIYNQFLIFNFQTFLEFLYLLITGCFLIVIFVYDLKHFIIPDKIIYPAIIASSIWYLASNIFFDFYTKYEILNTIYSAFAAGGFFLAIVLISKGKWMGVGDIKLAFFMGLFLGFPNIIVALFSAFLIGAIIGISLIIFNKKTFKSEVPFGPFLVVGTLISMFCTQQIINWYFNLFSL